MHFTTKTSSKSISYLEIHSWTSKLKESESSNELPIARGKERTLAKKGQLAFL